LDYQTKTKIIFDLDNLDAADKLHLKDNSISSYYLSPNMDLVAFRIDYEKRWRHSYKATDKKLKRPLATRSYQKIP